MTDRDRFYSAKVDQVKELTKDQSDWLKTFERFIDPETEYLEYREVKIGENTERRACVRKKDGSAINKR